MSILARFALVLVLFICLRGSEGGVQTPPSWVSGGAAVAATKYQTITVDQSGGRKPLFSLPLMPFLLIICNGFVFMSKLAFTSMVFFSILFTRYMICL
ncbi:hypothetical protein Hanom_Chr08g00687891 [Helianthus anomalus]